MTRPQVLAGLALAFVAGAIPHLVADMRGLKCPICFAGWAIWPVRDSKKKWSFVCRQHFNEHAP